VELYICSQYVFMACNGKLHCYINVTILHTGDTTVAHTSIIRLHVADVVVIRNLVARRSHIIHENLSVASKPIRNVQDTTHVVKPYACIKT
jgi:hypothetical protein